MYISRGFTNNGSFAFQLHAYGRAEAVKNRFIVIFLVKSPLFPWHGTSYNTFIFYIKESSLVF